MTDTSCSKWESTAFIPHPLNQRSNHRICRVHICGTQQFLRRTFRLQKRKGSPFGMGFAPMVSGILRSRKWRCETYLCLLNHGPCQQPAKPKYFYRYKTNQHQEERCEVSHQLIAHFALAKATQISLIDQPDDKRCQHRQNCTRKTQ